jgi:hypothetical protein
VLTGGVELNANRSTLSGAVIARCHVLSDSKLGNNVVDNLSCQLYCCPKLPCKFLGALPTSGTESGILVPSGMSAERKCYAAHNIAVVAGNDLWRRRGR